MAEFKLLFTFAIISLCVVYSMPKTLDYLLSKSKVHLKFDDYSDKPFVRIKKEMIKEDKCPKGMIYYAKQCRTFEEFERLKTENYDEDYTTEAVTYKTSKYEGEDDVMVVIGLHKNRSTITEENINDFTTEESTTDGSNPNTSVTNTEAIEVDVNSSSTVFYNIIANNNTVASDGVNTSVSSRNKLLLITVLTVFIVCFAVVLIWLFRNLYIRRYRRLELGRDVSLPDQEMTTYELQTSTKDTYNNTRSSYVALTLQV